MNVTFRNFFAGSAAYGAALVGTSFSGAGLTQATQRLLPPLTDATRSAESRIFGARVGVHDFGYGAQSAT